MPIKKKARKVRPLHTQHKKGGRIISSIHKNTHLLVSMGVKASSWGMTTTTSSNTTTCRATKKTTTTTPDVYEKKKGKKTFTLRPIETTTTNENENEKRLRKKIIVMHFVRHAEGTHNVAKAYNDPAHKDARLTARGKEQCRRLAEEQPLLLKAAAEEAATAGRGHVIKTKRRKRRRIIATSPMTRCIQTANLCFDKDAHEITETIAFEELRETVNYQCDIRRKTSELKKEFDGTTDFGRLEKDEEDPLWRYWIERCGSEEEHTTHRESAALHKCADRARKFFEWVENRALVEGHEEEEIIVSSHSAFLRCVFNYGHTQEKFEYHMGGSEQVFDDREDKTNNVKIVQYLPEDGDAFEEYMRRDYENCELRSAVLEIL